MLGDMHVRWQGVQYSFNRYGIAEDTGADGITLQDKNMVIVREGHRITLKTLKQEGDKEQ